MKQLYYRLSKTLLSLSFLILGGTFTAHSAHARPAATDGDLICFKYTVHYAECRHTITDKKTGEKKVIITKPTIPPYSSKEDGAKSAASACAGEGKKIRNGLDESNGNVDSKPLFRIENFIVGIGTEVREICIPKWILPRLLRPAACAEGIVMSTNDYDQTTSGPACGEVESEFDPSLLSHEEIGNLLEEGATDEAISSEIISINESAGTN